LLLQIVLLLEVPLLLLSFWVKFRHPSHYFRIPTPSAEGEHVEPYHAQHLPTPGPEHDWLQQLAGEWKMDMECPMEAGKPPMKSKGTVSIRSIGGFWIIAESKSTVMASG